MIKKKKKKKEIYRDKMSDCDDETSLSVSSISYSSSDDSSERTRKKTSKTNSKKKTTKFNRSRKNNSSSNSDRSSILSDGSSYSSSGEGGGITQSEPMVDEDILQNQALIEKQIKKLQAQKRALKKKQKMLKDQEIALLDLESEDRETALLEFGNARNAATGGVIYAKDFEKNYIKGIRTHEAFIRNRSKKSRSHGRDYDNVFMEESDDTSHDERTGMSSSSQSSLLGRRNTVLPDYEIGGYRQSSTGFQQDPQEIINRELLKIKKIISMFQHPNAENNMFETLFRTFFPDDYNPQTSLSVLITTKTPEMLKDRYEKFMSSLNDIKTNLIRYRILENNERAALDLKICFDLIYGGYTTLLSMISYKNRIKTRDDVYKFTDIEKKGIPASYIPTSIELGKDNAKHVFIVNHIITKMNDLGYRIEDPKHEEVQMGQFPKIKVYMPINIKGPDGKPIFTHCYKYYNQLFKVCMQLCGTPEYSDEFMHRYKSYTEKIAGRECYPKVTHYSVLDRSYAFRNGIYFADLPERCRKELRPSKYDSRYNDAFVSYDDSETLAIILRSPAGTSYAVYKFFDYDFDPEWLSCDPKEIVIPGIYKVASQQRWDETTLFYLFALLGRLNYPNGTDPYQVVPYFQGKSGTGKSLIITYALSAFNMWDIGVFGSSTQQVFGPSQVLRRKLGVCTEYRPEVGFPLDEILKIVSHEPTIANQKFGNSEFLVSPVNLLLAGNMFPCAGGEKKRDYDLALARRFVFFLFEHIVKEPDTSLPGNVLSEMGPYLLKANRCYMELRKQVGKNYIYNCLPKRFTDNQIKYASVQNPVISYLLNEHCAYFIAKKKDRFNYWTTVTEFEQAVNQFLRQTKAYTITPTTTQTGLEWFGLEVLERYIPPKSDSRTKTSEKDLSGLSEKTDPKFKVPSTRIFRNVILGLGKRVLYSENGFDEVDPKVLIYRSIRSPIVAEKMINEYLETERMLQEENEEDEEEDLTPCHANEDNGYEDEDEDEDEHEHEDEENMSAEVNTLGEDGSSSPSPPLSSPPSPPPIFQGSGWEEEESELISVPRTRSTRATPIVTPTTSGSSTPRRRVFSLKFPDPSASTPTRFDENNISEPISASQLNTELTKIVGKKRTLELITPSEGDEDSTKSDDHISKKMRLFEKWQKNH